MLVHWIESDLYARQGKAVTNFKSTLPPAQSDLAVEVVRDPSASPGTSPSLSKCSPPIWKEYFQARSKSQWSSRPGKSDEADAGFRKFAFPHVRDLVA